MRHTQTFKVKALLTACVLLLLTLSSALLYTLSNDVLLTASIFSVLAYLFSYIAYRIYLAWFEPIKQLQAFVNAKQQGQTNLSLHFADHSAPIAQLGMQLSNLFHQDEAQQQPLFFSLLQSWPTPIAVFDEQQKLCFFNHSMHQAVNQPLLTGMSQAETGFKITQNNVCHADFNQQWQLQLFKLKEQDYTLVSALFIGEQLQKAKRQSQADLIRILSHELTNSLTPMSSMAETLLEYDPLPESQTRQALTRVKSRSEALLSFIKSYATLSRLPEPHAQHFDLQGVVQACADEQNVELYYSGASNLIADAIQIEQVLINLIKNAKEAAESDAKVTIQNQVIGSWQQITVCDNGPGFANLSNALTPLYTTKPSGHGLGLAICQDIIERHGGELSLSNHQDGAKVTIRLPL